MKPLILALSLLLPLAALNAQDKEKKPDVPQGPVQTYPTGKSIGEWPRRVKFVAAFS